MFFPNIVDFDFCDSFLIIKEEVQHMSRAYMDSPTYSPDGKYIWTGSEWIPAPPTSDPVPPAPSEQALNMQDSVIGRDVVHSTVINNDPTAVTTAVIAALQQLGMLDKNRQHRKPHRRQKLNCLHHSVWVIMLNITVQPMNVG